MSKKNTYPRLDNGVIDNTNIVEVNIIGGKFITTIRDRLTGELIDRQTRPYDEETALEDLGRRIADAKARNEQRYGWLRAVRAQ